MNEIVKVNKEYKDSMFSRLFSDPVALREEAWEYGVEEGREQGLEQGLENRARNKAVKRA